MNQKSELFSNKLAAIQIDISFAIFIFVIIFLTFHAMYADRIDLQSRAHKIDNLNFVAKDVCQMLINSPGNPNNWETNINTIIFPGLKNLNHNNTLNAQKILAFNNTNYWDILNSMNIEKEGVNVKIIGIDTNTTYRNFGQFASDTYDVNFGNSVCYSNYNGEIVKVLVEVWV